MNRSKLAQSAPMICKERIIEAAKVIVNDDPDISAVVRMLEGITREAYRLGTESVIGRLEAMPDDKVAHGGDE